MNIIPYFILAKIAFHSCEDCNAFVRRSHAILRSFGNRVYYLPIIRDVLLNPDNAVWKGNEQKT